MSEQDERPENDESLKKKRLSVFRRLFRWAFRDDTDRLRDLHDLSEHIEDNPTEAVHYLLRADVHIELKQYKMAQADLERALELSENTLAESDWGLSAQAIRDKALHRLRQIEQYVE
jgi:tetratricopeptide (TPR) repeat protein